MTQIELEQQAYAWQMVVEALEKEGPIPAVVGETMTKAVCDQIRALQQERRRNDILAHDLGVAKERIEKLLEERDELKQRLDLSIQANGDLTDERDALKAQLADAHAIEFHSNGLLRSAYSIAARQGVQTNWNAFSTQVFAHLRAHNPYRSDVAAAPTSVQLKPGDKVTKSKGFKFPGIVVSLFTTSAGAERVVVEADHPDFAGMLHIYNPEQLEKR